MALKKIYVNAIILSLLALVVTIFVASNLDFRVGVIYAFFALAGIVVFFNVDKLKGFGQGLLGIEFGAGTDWVQDLVVGLLVFLPFVFVSSFLFKASIGVPALAVFSVSATSVITVAILAPILEELFFRGFLNGLFNYFGFGSIISFGVSSLAFAGFHLVAFTVGGYVSDVNPFIGAFIFGIFASGLSLYRNSILPSIFLHVINNSIALSKLVIAS